MFSRITGSIVERTPSGVVLETGGLAYEIILPPCVAQKVPSAPGAVVTLEIYAHLQIDGNTGRYTFFGFPNAIEREFFGALTSVPSTVPKSAARPFSPPMARIAKAIEQNDYVF